MANDFFNQMCKEALDELASGESGSWRDVSPNVLVMAAFGMLTNHLAHNITRPLWFFASSVFAGVVAFIVKSFLS